MELPLHRLHTPEAVGSITFHTAKAEAGLVLHSLLQHPREVIQKICCLLQEVAEEPKKMGPDSLLRQKVKQKRFREGYEEGLSSTHKATSALAFVMSDTPVEMLGQYSRYAASLPCAPAVHGGLLTCHAIASGMQGRLFVWLPWQGCQPE